MHLYLYPLFCLLVPHAPPQTLLCNYFLLFVVFKYAMLFYTAVTLHIYSFCPNFTLFLFLVNLVFKIAIRYYYLFKVIPR